jgi:hypothetical protein
MKEEQRADFTAQNGRIFQQDAPVWTAEKIDCTVLYFLLARPVLFAKILQKWP